ncbi:MAG: PEGA domain-containing protein [Deltaproteobacteria bacterium]|nr:PEGA domain-containing protein [Deltaproteobacteria bacterium]
MTTDVPGAHVWVDERDQGPAPVVVHGLAPGTHNVRVGLVGAAVMVARPVTVTAGRVEHLFLPLSSRLTPAAPPPTTPPATPPTTAPPRDEATVRRQCCTALDQAGSTGPGESRAGYLAAAAVCRGYVTSARSRRSFTEALRSALGGRSVPSACQ